MKCIQAKSLFSRYLDGAVTGMQMREVSRHLEACSDCNQEYGSLRQMQQVLAITRRRKAPPDLALRLRVAISREAARTRGCGDAERRHVCGGPRPPRGSVGGGGGGL